MKALKQLWKMIFISYKKLFLFWRYSNFCISYWLKGWPKLNLKVQDVSNCLLKNLITHFVWYIEKEKTCDIKLCQLTENYVRNIFMEKSCRQCAPKAVPDSFLILVNNLKQLLDARDSFKNEIFWKRAIKKPLKSF